MSTQPSPATFAKQLQAARAKGTNGSSYASGAGHLCSTVESRLSDELKASLTIRAQVPLSAEPTEAELRELTETMQDVDVDTALADLNSSGLQSDWLPTATDLGLSWTSHLRRFTVIDPIDPTEALDLEGEYLGMHLV